MSDTKQPLARGMRILTGQLASIRRDVLDTCRDVVERIGYREVVLPTVEPAWIYESKAGKEVLGQMYTFQDKKGRELCLRPEGTASCQLMLEPGLYWYEARCFRYERPQAGRYREFTQFGVELLGPTTRTSLLTMAALAQECIRKCGYDGSLETNTEATRGLAYYRDGRGFEISIPSLGAQKQVVGGGYYEGGVGFALGVDRLALALE